MTYKSLKFSTVSVTHKKGTVGVIDPALQARLGTALSNQQTRGTTLCFNRVGNSLKTPDHREEKPFAAQTDFVQHF